MSDGLRRLLREYNLISAAIISTLAFGSMMGWFTLSSEQWGGLLALVAAWLLVMRFLVTPVNDPILKPGTVINANSDYPSVVVPDIGD
jgi:hypothetical protein